MIKILFRKDIGTEEEFEAAKKWCVVETSRLSVKPGDLIIPRYSALPYYKELQSDVELLGGKLINSYAQHRYVADIENWYQDFVDLTPATYFDMLEAQAKCDGPFVLKGRTNSRKNNWTTHMFATRSNLTDVFGSLLDDPLIAEQGVVFREYESFEDYGRAINGAPITHEFRFFVYKGDVVSKGFYWANHPEVIERHQPDVDEVPADFVKEIIRRVGDKINFYAFDVARRWDSEWRLIELNDGQMSGLSTIDPSMFYYDLYKIAHKDDVNFCAYAPA